MDKSYFEGSDADLVDASGFGVEGYVPLVMFREEFLDLCSRIACQTIRSSEDERDS